jgi:hypothetical protein
MKSEVSTGFAPLAIGWYNGVITKVEVRDGAKAPYLSVEVTVHGDEYHGRKVWGMSSFSDKALTMPGGVVNLLQVTEPDIDMDTPASELPAVMAQAITSSPVSFLVKNEQVKRGGVLQFLDAPTNSVPEMRSKVDSYRTPEQDFIDGVEVEAAGGDTDLPF